MDSLSLLQQIFLIQESNWGLLHCRQILYQVSYQGSAYTHTHTNTRIHTHIYNIYIYTHTHIIYIYILLKILFHYDLSHDIEYSSLCYTVGSCYLYILYITASFVNPKLPVHPSSFQPSPGQPQVLNTALLMVLRSSLFLSVCVGRRQYTKDTLFVPN